VDEKKHLGIRGAAPGRRDMRAAARPWLVAVAAAWALLFLVSVGAVPVRGDGTGVTVIDVPPQFNSLDIRTQDGLNYVDVVVSDYNSWQDIFRVRVEVLNDLRAPVADVGFQQYPTNSSTVPQPTFNQSVGNYLVQDLSSARHSSQSVTIPQRTDLRLTFVLNPVKGAWINVSATDLGGLTSYAQVEYQSGFLGGLPPVASGAVAVIAAGATVLLVGARIRRDRRGG
jgi:hypothetical protein